MRYTTASEDNSEIVTKSAARFGVTVTRLKGKGNWHQLVFSGNGNRWEPKGVNKWLRELKIFNQRSHTKHIPETVFRLGNRQIALLLKHLWATDGTYYTPKPGQRSSSRIAFSTNSRQLADDVALLLLRFGIVARIRKVQQGNYRPMYTVDVSGKTDQLNFLNSIGAFGEKHTQAQLVRSYLDAKESNTNADTLPKEVFDIVRNEMKNKNISTRKMASLRNTSYGGSSHFLFAPSRKTIGNYAEILESEHLAKYADSDVFWDTVLEVVPCGEEEVYDLSVPGTNTWIADGIVSHNSGAIEQDADIVSFIYRPEYYQILEDENGQSLKGVAEIIISKHRHGALETIKLKFVDKFAKFDNLEDPAFSGLDTTLGEGPDNQSGIVSMPSRMNNDEDIPF